jgi:hypothetical protein
VGVGGSNPSGGAKQFGGSSGLRYGLAPCMTTRVRFSGPPPILSLCNVNLVDGLIWSQEAVGSNPTMETNFALLFQRLEFRFCSPAMAVRVRHGAPSFGIDDSLESLPV